MADAIAEVQRARRNSIRCRRSSTADLGWYLLYAGRHADAIAQFRKTLEFDANSVSAHRGLGIAYSEDGQHDEAIAALKRALTLSENSPVVLGDLGAAYARARQRAEAEGVLRAARRAVRAAVRAVVGARRWSTPRWATTCRALDSLEKALRRARLRDHADRGRAVVQALRGEPRFQQDLVNGWDCRQSQDSASRYDTYLQTL